MSQKQRQDLWCGQSCAGNLGDEKRKIEANEQRSSQRETLPPSSANTLWPVVPAQSCYEHFHTAATLAYSSRWRGRGVFHELRHRQQIHAKRRNQSQDAQGSSAGRGPGKHGSRAHDFYLLSRSPNVCHVHFDFDRLKGAQSVTQIIEMRAYAGSRGSG